MSGLSTKSVATCIYAESPTGNFVVFSSSTNYFIKSWLLSNREIKMLILTKIYHNNGYRQRLGPREEMRLIKTFKKLLEFVFRLSSTDLVLLAV